MSHPHSGTVVEIRADEHEHGVPHTHAHSGHHASHGHDHISMMQRMTLLEDVLYEPRPLLQHVIDDPAHAPVREPERKAGFDELFFDLIIVAVIAVMGDDFRKHYSGWSEIWRFALLYKTVISVWYDMTVLWNYVDTKRDFVEQITIILLIICLAGIGTRAEQAFRLTTRSLAFFAFFATLIAPIRLCLDTWLNKYDRRVLRNPRIMNAVLTTLFAVPYIVVAALPDDRSQSVPYLFLIAIILQTTRQLTFNPLFDWIRRRWWRGADIVMPAVHVEAMAERYSLITLIVFGETFVSTLVEGQKVFQPSSDVVLFGATTCAIVITFCLHSMYADVDNRLVAGDKHALSRPGLFGGLFMALHFPLHVCLILGASGLGILVELVGESVAVAAKGSGTPSKAAVHALVRAGGAASTLHDVPPDAVIWLVCCSYSGALMSMIALSFLHKRHEHRHITYVPRHALRFLAALCCFPLVPLTVRHRLSALALLGILGGIVTLIALVEVFFSQYDDHYSLSPASKLPNVSA